MPGGDLAEAGERVHDPRAGVLGQVLADTGLDLADVPVQIVQERELPEELVSGRLVQVERVERRAALEREEVRLLLQEDAESEELPAAQRPAFGWMLFLSLVRILTKSPRILKTPRMRLTPGGARYACGNMFLSQRVPSAMQSLRSDFGRPLR